MEMEMIYKFPGVYRGATLKKNYIMGDDDKIVFELEDNWVTGDLYVFPWPGTEKEPYPLCAVRPDGEEKTTKILVAFEKFNSQTGEWEKFRHLDELIRLSEEGKIKLSRQWIKEIKHMKSELIDEE